MTLPEFGLRGSCCDSIRLAFTCSNKNGMMPENASEVMPWFHHRLPMQYPICNIFNASFRSTTLIVPMGPFPLFFKTIAHW